MNKFVFFLNILKFCSINFQSRPTTTILLLWFDLCLRIVHVCGQNWNLKSLLRVNYYLLNKVGLIVEPVMHFDTSTQSSRLTKTAIDREREERERERKNRESTIDI